LFSIVQPNLNVTCQSIIEKNNALRSDAPIKTKEYLCECEKAKNAHLDISTLKNYLTQDTSYPSVCRFGRDPNRPPIPISTLNTPHTRVQINGTKCEKLAPSWPARSASRQRPPPIQPRQSPAHKRLRPSPRFLSCIHGSSRATRAFRKALGHIFGFRGGRTSALL
jgi:hypothetical protein